MQKITISYLDTHGTAIAFDEGKKVFIEGALAGEEVLVDIVENKATYKRGKLLSIEKASKERVKPPCPVFDRCGGCQLQQMSYSEQLKLKRQKVAEALLEDEKIASTLSSPFTYGYRNKMLMPVSKDGTLGLYSKRSHDIVLIDGCPVQCALGEEIFKVIQELLKKHPIQGYDEQTQEGELRFCLIKSAVHLNQALVIFVVNQPSSDNLKLLSKKLMERLPQVKGVAENLNSTRLNVVLTDQWKTLAGQSVMQEKIAGLTFNVSPASFFQVNPYQAEALYSHALQMACLTGSERVLDAYCGVGTLTLQIAKKAKHVIGIETVPEAIEDAKKNAKLNAIENVSWIADKVEKGIQSIDVCDVAFLNPPRKGCDPEVIGALGHLRPTKIIYLSCGPQTLARDGNLLKKYGYALQRAQPIDMFPQTTHVETVACFVMNRLGSED